MTLQDEFLRKAAVLIATLDDQAAETLLDLIGREQSLRVRRMLAELAPVSLDERSLVIQEFMHAGVTGSAGLQDSGGVEMDDSLAAKIALADSLASADEPAEEPADGALAQPGGAPAEHSPFSFLLAATPEVLGDLLAGEHAQTICLVLSHLPSVKVAEALQQLSAAQRSEVLERLGRLQATDESVAAEIAQQLQRQFHRRIREPGRPSVKRAAGHKVPESRRGPAVARPQPLGPSPKPVAKDAAKTAAPRESQPAFEFDDLSALTDQSLAMVFRRADPRVSLVALTGACPSLFDRIQRQLPWREARELRRQIERLGPVRLSDVEHAQSKLAETAATLIREKVIPSPPNRRFTTAA
jgi:flagellar motor switch protein FliG